MAQRVRQLCRSAVSARELQLRVIEEIRRGVGFDAYAFVLTDPRTCVGSSPLADVPWIDELPYLIRLKYQTSVNRWTALGDPPVALLQAGGEAERSLVWREYLARHGVGDVASVVFRDRFGCWAFLELWRCGPASRFVTDEAAALAAIVDPVTEAVRRTQAATFTEPTALGVRAGPLVLLMSAELDVRGQTAPTDDVLRHLLPPPPDRSPVPAAAYNVAAQLLANESGVDGHPALARVHLRAGVWLTLSAARIGNGPPTHRDIAVTVETTSPTDRLDLYARASGLSDRERDVLGHLVAGTDTATIAARLHLSPHTVLDHVKAISAKTGGGGRRALVARIIGG
jgi:DNA-binding CsgD family transcriptional regulator